MSDCGNNSRVEYRAFPPESRGSIPTLPLHFVVRQIHVNVARQFIEEHHSRLPYTQPGPWKFAFGAYEDGFRLVAVALWHNCSARGLPQDWLELRRMAVAEEAMPNTASKFMAQMTRWLKKNTAAPVVISYQDVSVHKGTIYRAAGWTPVAVSRPRLRDRSGLRVGTARKYRSDSNGDVPAASAKIRWQLGLRGQSFSPLSEATMSAALSMKPTR